MTHSPEPWQFGLSLNDPPGVFVAQSSNGEIVAHGGRSDMERIVAAVNACAGIPTEELVKRGAGAVHSYFEDKLKELAAELNKPNALTPAAEFAGKWASEIVAIDTLRAAGYTVEPPSKSDLSDKVSRSMR